ncbi:hypothetical protein MJO28_012000 [Puccinia striiformis f. sp. tritici]|uniref:Uncharacterized protein n=1 Tax=Puccinia striiformis f. sp. tritici TaxID=168172 RepID=A0ACC0E1N3_9BASI|nr:hypothetical protein MJO28_012000 [Puccinia striiformis f. sp. tritici]
MKLNTSMQWLMFLAAHLVWLACPIQGVPTEWPISFWGCLKGGKFTSDERGGGHTSIEAHRTAATRVICSGDSCQIVRDDPPVSTPGPRHTASDNQTAWLKLKLLLFGCVPRNQMEEWRQH